LLDQLRQTAFTRFGRPEPGDRYADWAHRYIVFHGKRHPRELGAGEVGRFLEHIAQSEKDPLRCLEQAHEALTFLYKDLLHLTLGELPCKSPSNPFLVSNCSFQDGPGSGKLGRSWMACYSKKAGRISTPATGWNAFASCVRN
jgi:hypothetical protein